MDTVRLMSYREWADRNADLVQALEERRAELEIVCETCDGDGWLECSCCSHVRECEACDGNGRILPPGKRTWEVDPRLYYERLIEREKDLLKRLGVDVEDVRGEGVRNDEAVG